jgi:hypothetical protein
MLGEGQSSKRTKGKAMKKGRTLRFIVVFLSGFLATTTSVYAAHFAAAGVESHVTDDTLVQFWFLRVASPTPDPSVFIPVIPTQFECRVVHKSPSMSFRLFASVKEIESFTVVTDTKTNFDTITITGKLLSRIFSVSERGVRFFTEITDFTATSVDKKIPGAGEDTFDLNFVYSMKGTGALLREAIPALVDCHDDKDTCTLELAGTVEKGEIEGHTTGGD